MKSLYLLTALSLGIFIIAGCATDKDAGKVKTLSKTTVAEPEPVKAPVVSYTSLGRWSVSTLWSGDLSKASLKYVKYRKFSKGWFCDDHGFDHSRDL